MIGVDGARLPGKKEPEIPCLAMRLRDAAKALGVSDGFLWQQTKRGVVPHIRVGKAVLYPVDSLRDWLKKQVQRAGSNGDEKNSEDCA